MPLAREGMTVEPGTLRHPGPGLRAWGPVVPLGAHSCGLGTGLGAGSIPVLWFLSLGSGSETPGEWPSLPGLLLSHRWEGACHDPSLPGLEQDKALEFFPGLGLSFTREGLRGYRERGVGTAAAYPSLSGHTEEGVLPSPPCFSPPDLLLLLDRLCIYYCKVRTNRPRVITTPEA